MSSVTDLERKVQSLEDQLREARASLSEALIAAAPVKIGDIVEEKHKRYRVTRIESYGSWYLLYGNLKKEDGSWGSMDQYIAGYQWRPLFK